MLSPHPMNVWSLLRNAIFDNTIDRMEEVDKLIMMLKGLTTKDRLALSELADELITQLHSRETTEIKRVYDEGSREQYVVASLVDGEWHAIYQTYNWAEALTIADAAEEFSA
jgi:hypothetical protein